MSKSKRNKINVRKIEYTVGMGFDAQPIVATHYVTVEKVDYKSKKWYEQ